MSNTFLRLRCISATLTQSPHVMHRRASWLGQYLHQLGDGVASDAKRHENKRRHSRHNPVIFFCRTELYLCIIQFYFKEHALFKASFSGGACLSARSDRFFRPDHSLENRSDRVNEQILTNLGTSPAKKIVRYFGANDVLIVIQNADIF